MLSLWLVLFSIGLLSLSGIPALFFPRHEDLGQKISTSLVVFASVVGLLALFLLYQHGSPIEWNTQKTLAHRGYSVKLDFINAPFLILVFVVPCLGSIFGLGYWKQRVQFENGQKLGLFYGFLTGAMGLVCIANDGILFLFAWEAMALSAFFAATVEDDNLEARKAGWIYLVAAHLGTLCLLAMFALWNQESGTFLFIANSVVNSEWSNVIFILALIGFGCKAGLMPFHIWLPGAHANAPSHVSAVMSGVMLKMGIYGLLRVISLLNISVAWWGELLLGLGMITGITGIAFAIGQQDIKRMLAYSSIENIGVIFIGIGLAVLGRYHGNWNLVTLGFGAVAFHVWNHGIFKSLLFFNAGIVVHTSHSREISHMGGLVKKLPYLSILFAIGAIAICGLPPLNGFSSEWVLYLGLMRSISLDTVTGFPFSALAFVALSLIGALALVAFAKLWGMVFLGNARMQPNLSVSKSEVNERESVVFGPMFVLALTCVLLGLFPSFIFPLLDRFSQAMSGWNLGLGQGHGHGHGLESETMRQLVSTKWILVFGLILFTVLGLALFIINKWPRKIPRTSSTGKVGTWDCGYALPTERMQYTGSSFSSMFVLLFKFVLRPQITVSEIRNHFPLNAKFNYLAPDVFLDKMLIPSFRYIGIQLGKLRVLQKGQTQFYILYILIIMFLLLLWRVES